MRRRITAIAALAAVAALAVGVLAGCGSNASTSANTGTSAASGQSSQAQAGPPDMSALFDKALAGLVSDGTLTAEQQTAISSALAAARPDGVQPGATPAPQSSPPSPPGAGQNSASDPSSMFADALDGLVDDGTISSAQEQSVLSALSDAMPQPPSGGAPTGTSSAS